MDAWNGVNCNAQCISVIYWQVWVHVEEHCVKIKMIVLEHTLVNINCIHSEHL